MIGDLDELVVTTRQSEIRCGLQAMAWGLAVAAFVIIFLVVRH